VKITESRDQWSRLYERSSYDLGVKRRTRRAILKLLLLLAAGTTVNVAVAWGLEAVHGWDMPFPRTTAVQSRRSTPDDNSFLNRLGWQPSPDSPEFGYETILHSRTRGAVDERHWVELKVPKSGALVGGGMQSPCPIARQIVAGWPMRSLEGEAWNSATAVRNPMLPQWVWHDAIRVIIHGRQPSFLPTRPLWPGFAINTLFYAGVLWVLFCGPFALRRMIRRRRGLCAACAYPIGSSEVCTECGAAV